MDRFNKNSFLDSLPDLQFSSDVQTSWNDLELGVMNYAKELHQKRIDNGIAGSAFNDWWSSCCELIANRQILISDVNFDGTHDDSDCQEYIELVNIGPLVIELSNWRINAGNDGQDMLFPKGSLIYPNSSLRVYTNKAGALSFNSRKSVWNNRGDKAFLYDQYGVLISTWLYGRKAHKDIAITQIFFDGKEKYTELDEYVEVANLDRYWIDLSGWKLIAGNNAEYIFPLGSKLKPNSKLRVYTNYLDEVTGGYSFESNKAIWNNKSGLGTLKDYRGETVSEYSYGEEF